MPATTLTRETNGTAKTVARLAPSPTGAQHVGNARTYLLAWLSARTRGGRVILRGEDIDSPRVKPGAMQQAIDDLRWLGLDWDEGPDAPGALGPYIQTERAPRYAAALDDLKAGDDVYPCTCSRSDIALAASAPHAGQEGPVYPGTCAGRTPEDADTLEPGSYCLRFRIPHDDPCEFTDAYAGRQICRPRTELGDFVVAKADGTPSYQLAVVVDDHAMGVTDVLRGDDLIPSTFRQLLLYRRFGMQPPTFTHVPLVVGPDGRRLAKRHGDTRISLLREAGHGPERLLGLLAFSCGWIDVCRPLTLAELLPLFDLTAVPKVPFPLTPDLWDWVAS